MSECRREVGADYVESLFINENSAQKKQFERIDLCLYINNPFCVKHCSYCIYNPHKLSAAEYKRFYFESLPMQLKWFENLFSIRQIDKVYFGGGTASLMSLDVYRNIKKLIPGFDKIQSKTIEINPAFVSDELFSELLDDGYTKFSFGVQSFNEEVLRENRRMKPDYNRLKRMIDKADAAGVVTSIDLLTFILDYSLEDLEILRQDLFIANNMFENLSTIILYPNFRVLKSNSSESGRQWNFRMLKELRLLIEDFAANSSYYPMGTKERSLDKEKIVGDHLTDYYLINGRKFETAEDYAKKSFYNCSYFTHSESIAKQMTIGVGAYGVSAPYSYIPGKCNIVLEDVEGTPKFYELV